ncbi:hypothetical protein C475_18928 [Halosimplex carlsbadense 2-9-1]|uniref:CRISPR-associated protein Cas6 C-terminal domain-containing protein n=1 Tax=Halosimplex carlsbadense 2-9-1 TaxID=797114 RepID=M0CFD8_9EURY|nr:hypothetical protein [Halosimplex carlsbadense]ELZ21062.1 hypothetical protein C475_18928 [Halosimplex carlsbadense 2-9-1]
MTLVQEVLLQLEQDYMGHPYFVSGNAVFTALARELDDAATNAVQASTGVFVPGTHGAFPDEHSQSGGKPYFGTSLRPVEAYEDLFLFRDAAQRWIGDAGPRDAENTHEMRSYAGRTGFAPASWFGKPVAAHGRKRTVNSYLHCYVHAAGSRQDVLPLDDDVLDGLRVGGARNLGLGATSLADTQTVVLENLEYSRVRDADALQVELVSPYVLETDHPAADDQSVPWWWGVDDESLRRRESRLVRGGESFELTTVDHGQVVPYTGSDPVMTAQQGVLRVGSHSKFGFGEFRVRPASEDRVQGRASPSGDVREGGA